jgi:hypothetical protein
MSTRRAIHALVDELEDAKLELARAALEEIRDEEFELSDADARELLEREAECDHGETVNARAFLAELRDKGPSDSHG